MRTHNRGATEKAMWNEEAASNEGGVFASRVRQFFIAGEKFFGLLDINWKGQRRLQAMSPTSKDNNSTKLLAAVPHFH